MNNTIEKCKVKCIGCKRWYAVEQTTYDEQTDGNICQACRVDRITSNKGIANNSPVCPDCNEALTKSFIECDDGSGWYCGWLCGCKPPAQGSQNNAYKKCLKDLMSIMWYRGDMPEEGKAIDILKKHFV